MLIHRECGHEIVHRKIYTSHYKVYSAGDTFMKVGIGSLIQGTRNKPYKSELYCPQCKAEELSYEDVINDEIEEEKQKMPILLDKVREDAFEKGIVKTEQVVCEACHTSHDLDSDKYISVYGNICIGRSGGIVGNNFDEEGMLNRVHIFCRNKECFDLVIGQLSERRI